MLNLSGYDVHTLLHKGRYSRVYKATRMTDALPVVLKCLVQPSTIRAAKLRREFELGRFFRSETILQYYGLQKSGNGPVIIMEDFGGRPLTAFLDEKGLELPFFLDVAVKLAKVIEEVHRRNVIHKDIKPDNFLLNQESGEIKIIDFGIASLLPSERATLKTPEMLEGTIGYMSPEQRGITNRLVDYRTDFFALGATFYHLIRGSLPTTGADSIDSFNSDYEEDPYEVSESLPDLEDCPVMLANIIKKCMAEDPEDRYRTAYGLRADLERVRDALKGTGQAPEFKLGQQDLSQRLQVPRKLYGRDYEISRLLTAFQRVRDEQRCYMVLVSGEAGIGKSSVIHEVQKPIVTKRGYFVSGRCGQFKRETPYDPFISVSKALLNQILTEPDQKIARWKSRLKEVLGENGKLISDMAPEVESLLGPQPEPPEVKPEDSQVRFQKVFQQFLSVFAKPEHPLTVFLDDLHWADDASLSLLEYLLTYSGKQSLFLIGTYRFDGSKGAHMLVSLVKRLGSYGELFETLSVSPLNLDDTARLIADTLGFHTQTAISLARVVHDRSRGNPFFLIQLLKYLYQKDLLKCNLKAGAWTWSVEEIKENGLPDDIIEMITENLLQLTPKTLELVKQAACVGHRFDLKTLSMVRGKSPRAVAEELMDALTQGWIQPDDESYKYLVGAPREERRSPERFITYTFMHDYVQQAAYELLSEDEAGRLHYAIGRHFFGSIDRSRTDRYIMEIVEHLHKADIRDPLERLLLAEWYLRAGQKAGSTAGFTLGLNYFQLGWEYVSPSIWDDHYKLALQLKIGAAEMAFFSGKYDLMEDYCLMVEQHARATLDLIKVQQLRAQHHAAHHQIKETLAVVEGGLRLLNMAMPPAVPRDTLRAHFEILLKDAGGVDGLRALPTMKEQERRAAIQLMSCAITSAYFDKPEMFPGMVLEMVRLSVRHGNAPESCSAYACLAIMLEDIHLAYEIGELAVELLERFDVRRLRPQVYYHFCAFLQHRKVHMDQVLSLLRRSIVAGYEIREIEYAARCEVEYAAGVFFKGNDLETVSNRLKRFTVMTSQAGEERSVLVLNIIRQMAVDLMGRGGMVHPLSGPYYDEEKHLDRILKIDYTEGLFYAYLARMVLRFFHGHLGRAKDAADMAEPLLHSVSNRMAQPEFCFFAGLVCLNHIHVVPLRERRILLERVERYISLLRRWSDHAPMNRLHQYHLLMAEQARVQEQNWEALLHYEQAAGLAHDHQFPLVEALIFERAGAFFIEHGNRRCAEPYLIQAFLGYQKLGIHIKTHELQGRHGALLESRAIGSQ